MRTVTIKTAFNDLDVILFLNKAGFSNISYALLIGVILFIERSKKLIGLISLVCIFSFWSIVLLNKYEFTSIKYTHSLVLCLVGGMLLFPTALIISFLAERLRRRKILKINELFKKVYKLKLEGYSEAINHIKPENRDDILDELIKLSNQKIENLSKTN